MEELAKDEVPNMEDYPSLKEYEYIFGEFPGFPPKRDIEFSIDLIPEAAPMSKNPYRMSTSV